MKRSRPITPLRRPCTRRIGRLVVTIDHTGVRFRGKHKRHWRVVTWEQIAALSDPGTIMHAAEVSAGRRELERIGATENGRNAVQRHRAAKDGATDQQGAEPGGAGVGHSARQDGGCP